jgi:predicted GTPase
MGYSPEQRQDLEETINASDADIVLIGSPIDLRAICKLDKPAVRVFYELEDVGEPSLESVLRQRLGL